MALARRIALFLLVNFLVMMTISFILSIFNIQPYMNQYGLDLPSLAIFCLMWGMVGSLISLLLSKVMAKWTMGVHVIDPSTTNSEEKAVLNAVYALAKKAGLPKMPEVGIFNSPEANAFATGPSKSNALVALSSGLLNKMNRDEVEAVIGHEITHIANGDMVTMTLLQGIINAFVMFFARVLAFVIAKTVAGSREESSSSDSFSPVVYYITTFILEMCFMVLGSLVIARFSRFREFRADKGGAILAGRDNMIGALQALQRLTKIQDPKLAAPAYQAFKISGSGSVMKLFASHPPLEERIARLENHNSLA